MSVIAEPTDTVFGSLNGAKSLQYREIMRFCMREGSYAVLGTQNEELQLGGPTQVL